MRQSLKVLIFILVLAPFLGEVMSISTPLFFFLNPFIFILLVMLYGFGALIIRELAIKWDLGYIGILLLGAAYGIIEEGIILRSFFNPNWADSFDFLYGRVGEINLIWTVELIIFHSFISIFMTLYMADITFPTLKNTRLLSDKRLKIVVLLFIIIPAPLFYIDNPYSPPLLEYSLFFIITILLVLLARTDFINNLEFSDKIYSDWIIQLHGVLFISLLFLIAWFGPAFGLNVYLIVFLQISHFIVMIYLIRSSINTDKNIVLLKGMIYSYVFLMLMINFTDIGQWISSVILLFYNYRINRINSY